MKRANYHTHTVRCGHAVGADEEYVKAAIAMGMEVLGFADHGPQVYEDGFVSTIRMQMSELPEYVESLLQLREKYKRQIDIKIGLEYEYYPELFDKLRDELVKYPVDYLIMGQHFVEPERLGKHVVDPFSEEERLSAYVDRVLEGLRTGAFTYLAHPDMVHFVGDANAYLYHMRRLCEECKNMGIPLEVNRQGMVRKRNYPNEVFWKLAADVGNHVIFGYDAHTPDALTDEETYLKGVKWANDLGNFVDEMYRIG